MSQLFIPTSNTWWRVRDGHPYAMLLFKRHYTFREGRKKALFVGPGEKEVLITEDGGAMFVWRKFIDDSGQDGINCAVFRNESKQRSSHLILEAEKIALLRWGNVRLYTYVDPKSIRGTNPGYCFKMAGWKNCGVTKKNKLVILEKQL